MLPILLPHPSRAKAKRSVRVALTLLLGSVLLGTAGCDKSEDAGLAAARTPKEAASHLETAFDQAGESARLAAKAAAEAIRQKDYEKAVASLEVARSGGNVTLAQGMAVQGSIVALEGELLAAAQAGDPKAKQAYQLLKAMKSK